MQFLLGQIITIVLPCMTIITEMCWAPAEPLRYGAAELAFELYEVSTMCFTLFDTSTHCTCSTTTTHQLLWVELTLSLVIVLTRFETSKVRFLAFETHVVREPGHGVRLELTIEWWLLHSFIFVNAFVLGSLDTHLNHFLFKHVSFSQHGTSHWVVAWHSCLAGRAVSEWEVDAWACPLLTQSWDQALRMEYVFAIKLNARWLAQSFSVAADAVIIGCLFQCEPRWKCHTVRV